MVGITGISPDTRDRINLLKIKEHLGTIEGTLKFMLDYFDKFLITKQDIEDIVGEECSCADKVHRDIVERIMGLKI